MSDFTNEPQIRLTKAARLVRRGRGGRAANAAALHRLIHRGVIGPNGVRVRLEAIRVAGGVWMTTAAAVRRFLEALTPTS
jgi:hypothetical protein